MTTIVVVTTEHIERGEPENCERCPVALAIMDALPAAGVPSVGPSEVAFRVADDMWTDVHLPPEVSDFIESFDGGATDIGPFSFDLDYPAAVAA
jgi:hypothetical protein